MTDGAALPLAFSNTVAILKERNIICGSVTAGHAFWRRFGGGKCELFRLLAAKKVLAADVIICAMGPGSRDWQQWGFTGVEQGDILNAVESLQEFHSRTQDRIRRYPKGTGDKPPYP